MSRVQMLRNLVNQRLNAAAEEIFGLVVKTISEYEEEIDRQRRQLENLQKPEIHAETPEPPQVLVCIEDAPTEQQGNPEPKPITEEQKELCPRQEGEQLEWQEKEVKFSPSLVPVKSETDEKPLLPPQHSITTLPLEWQKEEDVKFSPSLVPVKSETDEKPLLPPQHSSTTEWIKTEPERHNYEESSSAINPGAAGAAQTTDVVQFLSSPGCEKQTEDDDDGQSDLNTVKSNNILNHTNTQIRGRAFICNVCGERLPSEEQLSRHTTAHSEKKAFNCPVCGKGFHKRAPLKVHLRTHTGERRFRCSMCDKSFIHKLTLQRHMTTHTGEKPFDCSVCGRRFSLKCNLTTHMRLHTGEKPYSCVDCGRRFVQKCNLKAHMRFHTGEKPYDCSRCGRKFSRLSYVKSHKCETDESAGKA